MTPGVVTGDDYARLVDACKLGRYALPAVNVVGTNSANAVLEAAAKARSDVIIQVSNGGAAFYGGSGLKSSDTARRLGAVSLARHIHLVAAEYDICVVLHTDHANRKLLPWIDGLIEENRTFYKTHAKPLFSSHMIDLSTEPVPQNIATCADYLDAFSEMGISLEFELGVTGGEEDGVGSDDLSDSAKLYTSPEDVFYAYTKLNGVGHFTVAASFGNVHGVYRPGNVKLEPKILDDCQQYVAGKLNNGDARPCSFVFHGGSGSSAQDIRAAVDYGVFKMNIDTDTQFAFAQSAYAYMAAQPTAFKAQLDPETGRPTKSVYDPRKWLRQGENGIIERLNDAFDILGSRGHTLAG